MQTLDYSRAERRSGLRRILLLAVVAGLLGFLLFQLLDKRATTTSVPAKMAPIGAISVTSAPTASNLQEGSNVMYGDFHATVMGSRPTMPEAAPYEIQPDFFIVARIDDLCPPVFTVPSTRPSDDSKH